MKQAILLLILMCTSICMYAQWDRKTKFVLGAGLNYSYPLGDFSKQANSGFGIELNGAYILNRKLSVGVEVSYSILPQDDLWRTNSNDSYEVDYNLASLFFNGTYFIDAWDQDFKPYVAIGFGYFMYRQKLNYNSTNEYNPQQYTIKIDKVGISPIAGFMYYLSRDLLIDTSIKFTYIPGIPKTVEHPYKDNGERYYLGFEKILMPKLSLGIKYSF